MKKLKKVDTGISGINLVYNNFEMKIQIVSSTGTGSTLLSAFDGALQNAGVENYNLIPLSSIIPPGSRVEKIGKYKTPANEFGHKLYIIKSDIRSDQRGLVIGVALGWYQLADGRGFFVEHESHGMDEAGVEKELKDKIISSLQDLCSNRGLEFDLKKVQSAHTVVKVQDQPTCALVLALYQSGGWK